MKWLLIGYSQIAQKRVLPALALDTSLVVDIATQTRGDQAAISCREGGKIYRSYANAIEDSDAEVVYISTRNADHQSWAQRALRSGRHVVVDKPACPDLAAAEQLLQLADENQRVLAESTVYGEHPQFAAVQQAFDATGDSPLLITATFSFPPLPAANFRYQRDDGGGAIADLGPYAVSPGRLFFDGLPTQLSCEIGGWQGDVETSFSMLASYSHGRRMIGHFGFTTQYSNWLEITGAHTRVHVPRAFTMPSNTEAVIAVRQDNDVTEITIPPSDCFQRFLERVMNDIRAGDTQRLASILHHDAQVLDRLRSANGSRQQAA